MMLISSRLLIRKGCHCCMVMGSAVPGAGIIRRNVVMGMGMMGKGWR